MTDHYDEIGWGNASRHGRWHDLVGDMLCVGAGVTMASLWAASCLACLLLPGRRDPDHAESAAVQTIFTEIG